MNTSPQRIRSREGFTLIEILIAMLILAVGLLGLEALGIGAARAVSRAQKQSQLAVVASDTLERTLNRIRRDEVFANASHVSLIGNPGREDTLRMEISTDPAGSSALTKVRVTVIPFPASKVLSRHDSLTVSGYVYN